ncbi:MAG: hypothetical protein ACLR8Y_19725 [Alistipes indistinctus]
MTRRGVISSEQPVQEHTRIVTDAKKREYPFHKIDRVESKKPDGEIPSDYPAEYIRYIDLRPDPSFFVHRLARFVTRTMDPDDYRCKVVKHGTSSRNWSSSRKVTLKYPDRQLPAQLYGRHQPAGHP